MVITIASGKGGTGKTTIATNLAVSLMRAGSRRSIQLVDCDVEEPNAGLFLNPVWENSKNVERLLPVFDQEKCSACEQCADICEYNAIAVVNGKVLFFKELCHACGSCVLNCPQGAIAETPEIVGKLEHGHHEKLLFSQGTLEIGFSSPVPVIRDLKKWALLPNEKETVSIIDASPGTTCPVVESLRGADAALLVTEPTPFGLHDLTLVAELVTKMDQKPIAVVINKSNDNDPIIEEFCLQKNIPILMRLPLSREIAHTYSKGQLVVDAFPQYQQQFIAYLKTSRN